MLRTPSTSILVARIDGQIAGMALLLTLTTLAGDFGYVEEVAVDPADRGQHISTALMTGLLDRAARKGLQYVELTSRPSRDVADGLYRSVGFSLRETNRYRDIYGISYSVEIEGSATEPELRSLVSQVDAIAEIPNSLRQGTHVLLASTTASVSVVPPALACAGRWRDLEGSLMADADDVRRLALALPHVIEIESDGFDFRVADKGFIWSYPERIKGSPRLIRTDIAVLFVGDEAEKQALLLGEPAIFFSAPGYDGWPLVMLRLAEVSIERLRELVTDAWRMRAPDGLAGDLDEAGERTRQTSRSRLRES